MQVWRWNVTKELARSVPEEEVWLAIKKADKHDVVSLVRNTSVDQLQYILDVELWKRDQFLPEHALEWLKLLKECGKEKVVQWAHEADPDLVVLTFKEFVTIFKKESTEDNPLDREWPLQEISPMTFDGSYYFQCNSQEADEIVRPIIQFIVHDDPEFFVKICEAVMSDLRSNLEEASFSWRTKRLSEKGFVSLNEALEVYAYISERQIATLPKRSDRSIIETAVVSLYPLANSGELYPVFMLALAGLKEKTLYNEVLKELAILANKVVIADGRPITPETIEASLKKAMGYVNIGLEHLSGANLESAGKILNERFLVHLFQIGFSLVTRLRQQARKFVAYGWPKDVNGDLSLLNEKLEGLIAGALRKKPYYFSGELPENPYREFRSIDEVRSVEGNFEYAEYVGRMFADVFKLLPSEIKNMTFDRELMQWENVLLTIWAKGTATGQYKFAPLTEKELGSVLKKKISSEKFIDWLLERQPNVNKAEEKHCRSFVENCFDKFKDEFEEIEDAKKLDWRFVRSVWVIPKVD